MKTMQDWLDAYGVSHQNPTNKLVHWICVPSIVFSLLGLLWSIPVGGISPHPYINVATVFYVVALVFYLRLSPIMAAGMALFVGLILWLVSFIDVQGLPLATISISVFVVAWIGQFIGHKIEGQKPSFLEDVQFLLIGPAWLLSFIYKKVGIKY